MTDKPPKCFMPECENDGLVSVAIRGHPKRELICPQCVNRAYDEQGKPKIPLTQELTLVRVTEDTGTVQPTEPKA